MALRCLLGKMGSNNKLLHNKGRIIITLQTSEVFGLKNKGSLLMGSPAHSSRYFGDIDNRAQTPMGTRKEGFDYYTGLGGLRPARFAMEEFNKLKKTQLQLMRVVGLWMKPQGYRHDPCQCLYVILMEAVDADDVKQLYQARVQLHDSTEGMCLEALHRCYLYESVPVIMYERLYHFLDNFFNAMEKSSAIARKK